MSILRCALLKKKTEIFVNVKPVKSAKIVQTDLCYDYGKVVDEMPLTKLTDIQVMESKHHYCR